jgi:hypothetical protein
MSSRRPEDQAPAAVAAAPRGDGGRLRAVLVAGHTAGLALAPTIALTKEVPTDGLVESDSDFDSSDLDSELSFGSFADGDLEGDERLRMDALDVDGTDSLGGVLKRRAGKAASRMGRKAGRGAKAAGRAIGKAAKNTRDAWNNYGAHTDEKVVPGLIRIFDDSQGEEDVMQLVKNLKEAKTLHRQLGEDILETEYYKEVIKKRYEALKKRIRKKGKR